jgi:DNA-binding winged helix-turn-helix (wHTH) protein
MVYRFRDFEADPAKGCLRRGIEEVPLRRKAFQVLVVLLEHHDRLVTREELFAAVWPDTAVTDDVLAGVITELRKALQDSPKSPLFIKTVPRVGYRFIGLAECIEATPSPAVVKSPAAEIGAPPPPRRMALPKRIWFTAALAVMALGGWLLLQQTRGRILAPGDSELGEVAWWRFDETSGNKTADASGGGNTGNIFGGVSRVPGKLGMALSLDGHTGYVHGTDRAGVLPAGDASRTVTAWFRTNSPNGDVTHLFLLGEDAPQPIPGHRDPGRAKFNVSMRMDGRLLQGVDIPGHGLDSRNRFDDFQWHQVAGVWKGSAATGEAHLFVDGTEEAHAKLTVPFATMPRSRWWIGGNPQGTLFRGQVDDVRVFNGALSAPQVGALYRCSSAAADLDFGGQPYYFLPIFQSGAEFVAGRRPQDGPVIRNPGLDFGGVQFAKVKGGCALDWLKGDDMGQDLRITVDLMVPTDAALHTTEAGPYLRSRRAAAGDGIVGGTSAGYWVLLFSSGSVSVQRLNPSAVVAFASIPDFDPAVFHHMEVAAVGERMQVKVDGNLLQFDQGGRQTATVSIPSVWQGPPAVGFNRGAAGVAFSTRQNRSAIGGQVAKGIRVERATALFTEPRP